MGNVSTPDRSDLELIATYKESEDNRLVGELFRRHQSMILGTCIKFLKHREEAQDASMDIFEELLVKLLKHDVTNFKSWLYSLTSNHCRMKIRKRKGIIEEEFSAEKNETYFMETPDYEHLDSEAQSEIDLLDSALSQLKEHQAECVRLFYLKEMSYKEVAAKTGYELKKVKSYIQNGKRNLQLILFKAKNPRS